MKDLGIRMLFGAQQMALVGAQPINKLARQMFLVTDHIFDELLEEQEKTTSQLLVRSEKIP